MLHFFGFLILIVIAVIIIGLTLVGSVLRALFGFGKRSTPNAQSSSNGRKYYRASETNKEEEMSTESDSAKHKKLFTDEEGEYVDFEEIKEEK